MVLTKRDVWENIAKHGSCSSIVCYRCPYYYHEEPCPDSETMNRAVAETILHKEVVKKYGYASDQLNKAKEIIKEMLSVLPKENIEGIYEITENAEQFLNSEVADLGEVNNQLNRAREIIKKYYKYNPSCEYFYEDIDKEAEQFLNSEVAK